MTTILILEIRGFTKLSSDLARDMEIIGLSPDRIRSAGIHFINEAVAQSQLKYHVTNKMHLGGDTWFFAFDDFEEGVRFAVVLLNCLHHLVSEKGLFYIKPSMAINIGEPKYSGERFLDDDSIATYRAADSGRPFHLFVLDKAIKLAQRLAWLKLQPIEDADVGTKQLIDWQTAQVDLNVEGYVNLAEKLPTLLLDSEVIYSNSPSEAIANISRQQSKASSIFAFGGPVPLDAPVYKNYLRSSVNLIKNKSECKWTVLSYLPLNETVHTYTWIELCRRLSVLYSDRYAFSAFTIPEGQLRPFSYQIFDGSTVHIGLRSFSPHRGTPTMSSAIMLRNKQIASRFQDEFLENLRQIGILNDAAWGHIINNIKGLNAIIKRNSLQTVEEILNE